MALADDAKTYITIRKASFATDANIDALIDYAIKQTNEDKFSPNADKAVALRVMHWLEKKAMEGTDGSGNIVKRKKEDKLEVEYSVSSNSGSGGSGGSNDAGDKINWDLQNTSWGRELLELIRTHITVDFSWF